MAPPPFPKKNLTGRPKGSQPRLSRVPVGGPLQSSKNPCQGAVSGEIGGAAVSGARGSSGALIANRLRAKTPPLGGAQGNRARVASGVKVLSEEVHIDLIAAEAVAVEGLAAPAHLLKP